MALNRTKIFMIAGEASGDVLGASLMRSMDGRFECSGVGGTLMMEQGLKSVLPMSEICVMGIWEVIWQLPRLLKLIDGMVLEVEKQQPDALITIDLPDFNFQVAKRLKQRGIYKGKIIHYVAPTVWAWRPGRAKKIAAFLDGIMCLFPFEPPYFEEHKLEAKYVGHPLVYQDHKKETDSFRRQYEIADDTFVFGVYLGSREAEIKQHKEVFQDAINFMLEQYPNLQVIVPTIPEVEYCAIDAMKGLNVDPIIVSNPKHKWIAMRSCNLAIAVSGTVGLELAYMNIPHVVAYKTHPLTALIIKLLVKVKYAHLVNILLDKPVVPEYLQGRCKPIPIAQELLRLLKDEALMAQQKVAFHDARRILKKDVDESPSDTALAYIMQKIRAD